MPYKQALQADNYELTNILAKVIKRKNLSTPSIDLPMASVALSTSYMDYNDDPGTQIGVIAPNLSEITYYYGLPRDSPLLIETPINSLIILGPCEPYKGHHLAECIGARQIFYYIDSETLDDVWNGATDEMVSLYSIFQIINTEASLCFDQAYREKQGEDPI